MVLPKSMKVIVYTVATCKYSAEEKAYLKTQNISFEQKDVEKDHEALETMLKVGNNFAGTPVTQIVKDDGSQIVLKGFTQSEFDDALGIAPQTAAQTTTPPVTQEPVAATAVAPATILAPSDQPNAPMPSVAASTEPVTLPAPTQLDATVVGIPQQPMPIDTTSAPAQAPIMQVVEPATGAIPPNPLDNILKDLQGQIASAAPPQSAPPMPTPYVQPPLAAPVSAAMPPMPPPQQTQPMNTYSDPMAQMNIAQPPMAAPVAAPTVTYQQQPPTQPAAPSMPTFPNPQ